MNKEEVLKEVARYLRNKHQELLDCVGVYDIDSRDYQCEIEDLEELIDKLVQLGY